MCKIPQGSWVGDSMKMEDAVYQLEKYMAEALSRFGRLTKSLPEIEYCRNAAEAFETEAQILRERESELSELEES